MGLLPVRERPEPPFFLPLVPPPLGTAAAAAAAGAVAGAGMAAVVGVAAWVLASTVPAQGWGWEWSAGRDGVTWSSRSWS